MPRARYATDRRKMRLFPDTRDAVTAAGAGTLDAPVSGVRPSQHQLTWDDAMLILVCWIIIIWLILGG